MISSKETRLPKHIIKASAVGNVVEAFPFVHQPIHKTYFFLLTWPECVQCLEIKIIFHGLVIAVR